MNTDIDFDKYKRIFAFGCSYTNYAWPTWADLIAVEAENSEYFNHGIAGLGNIAIAAKITEASLHYNFNKDDLIMVMWSTFCREDRWVNGKWLSYGNIWHSGYPDSWIKQYADPIGYLIRDHAIINMANKMLDGLPCDSIKLCSSEMLYTENEVADTHQFRDHCKTIDMLYRRDYENMPKSLYTFLNGFKTIEPITYIEDQEPGLVKRRSHDCHPKSTVYCNYLNYAGIKLSDRTKEFADAADLTLNRCRTRTDLRNSFEKQIGDRRSKKYIHLF